MTMDVRDAYITRYVCVCDIRKLKTRLDILTIETQTVQMIQSWSDMCYGAKLMVYGQRVGLKKVILAMAYRHSAFYTHSLLSSLL